MTVTSNILVGLAAWTNHSFALNECCSNTSNAYRCITAGTSTAAPTGTGSSISPGGTAVFKWLSTFGASDYSTIAAWITSIPATPSQNYIGLLWNNAEIVTTATISLTGHTTTATNNITLQCAPGESFADNPNSSSNPLFPSPSYGVQIRCNLQYGTLMTCNDAWSAFDGIQFSYGPATKFQQGLGLGGNGITLTRCNMRWKNTETSNGLIGTSGTAIITLVNCVFIDQATNNNTGIRCASNVLTMTNCILYSQTGTTLAGLHSNYVTGTSVTATNNIIIGYGVFSNTNWASMTARNNLTSNASYPAGWTDTGAASLFSKTAANQFVSTTTDFKLKTGADALNAGFADTTHIPSATDVYGTSRPQGAAWDIGPYEMVSAGPPPYRARVVRWG